jgi:hypothetical protein
MTLPHRRRYHAPQGEEEGRSETFIGVKVAVAGVREKEKDKGSRFNLLAMGTFVAVRDALNNTGRQHLFRRLSSFSEVVFFVTSNFFRHDAYGKRQGKTRQGKGKARGDKARRGETRQDKQAWTKEVRKSKEEERWERFFFTTSIFPPL